MLEAYSSAYYIDRLAVEPATDDRAVLERDQHREAARTVYATGVGVERLDLPLVVKIGALHLPVFGGDSVPRGTLAVPGPVIEETDIEDPPTITEVLVAKADRARQLLEWFTPYTVEPSTDA